MMEPMQQDIYGNEAPWLGGGGTMTDKATRDRLAAVEGLQARLALDDPGLHLVLRYATEISRRADAVRCLPDDTLADLWALVEDSIDIHHVSPAAKVKAFTDHLADLQRRADDFTEHVGVCEWCDWI